MPLTDLETNWSEHRCGSMDQQEFEAFMQAKRALLPPPPPTTADVDSDEGDGDGDTVPMKRSNAKRKRRDRFEERSSGDESDGAKDGDEPSAKCPRTV